MVAAKSAAAARAGIAYPGNGRVIALDPDIPQTLQRVRFLIAPEAAGYRWRMDAEDLGNADFPLLWIP